MNCEKFFQAFSDFEKTHILNGTISAALDAQTFFAKGFGIADAQTRMPCTPQTLYNIASVTKQFIAATLLRVLYDSQPSLHHLQKALEKPLFHYLPPEDALWNDAMPEWAKEVTLHQLLTHTSGIVNYTNLDAFWDQLYIIQAPCLPDLIGIFKEFPLNFTPGSQYEYSNSGYVLLGQVIARLSKKDLSCYLKEIFFTPLDMTNTSLPARGTTWTLKQEDKYSHLARGYTYTINHPTEPYTELKNYWPLEIDQGDGGIISCAEDLIRWNTALYKGYVLPPEILNLMLAKHEKIPVEENVPSTFSGYGIVCRELPIGDVYGHNGAIPGYRTTLEYVPYLNLTVASFSNVSFDSSCIQEEEDNLRKELSHIKDARENQREFNKIFKMRYPHLMEIMQKHALLQFKDLGI